MQTEGRQSNSLRRVIILFKDKNVYIICHLYTFNPIFLAKLIAGTYFDTPIY